MFDLKRGFLAFLLSFLLLISASSVLASDFSVSVSAVQDTVTNDEPATYELTITNDQRSADTFRIRAPEIFWSVQSKPLYHYFGGVDVPAGGSRTVTLLINPIKPIPNGQYRVQLDIDSIDTGDSFQIYPVINIHSSSAPKNYLPSFSRTVEMPQKVDPRKIVPVTVVLENKNPKDISSVIITANSNLISKEWHVPLPPLAHRTFKLNFSLDEKTAPQKDSITWSFRVENTSFDNIKTSYEIVAYDSVTEQKAPVSSGFMSSTQQVTFENRGNSVATTTAEIKTGLIKKLFSKTTPKSYSVNKPDGMFYAWDLSIAPGEKVTVKVTEDYSILFWLLVLGIVGAICYFIFRSPIVVRKEAAVIGFEEGGISDIKVILHVKNRTGKQFDNLSIADKVPSIANIVKESEVGSVKPSKTVQTKDGAIIKWELDKLEKYEERVFSYTIKSKLSILGTFSLPRTQAKYFFNKVEKKVHSNPAHLKI